MRKLLMLIFMVFTGMICYSQDYGTFIDSRDNRIYKTIKIGNQLWMAENIAFKLKNECVAYQKKNKNKAQYGYLYTWFAAQKVCPEGWHLPSANEYEVLLSNLNNDSDSAFYALVQGGSSGFSMQFGGLRNDEGNFYQLDQNASFWTSNEGEDIFSPCFSIYKEEKSIGIIPCSKLFSYSVRCIKND